MHGLDGAVGAAGYLAAGGLGRAPLVVAGAPAPAPHPVSGLAARALVSAPADLAGALDRLLAGVVDSKTTGAANAYGSAMYYSIVYLITTMVYFCSLTYSST